jgi:hypothetical protein
MKCWLPVFRTVRGYDFFIATRDDKFPPVIWNGDKDKLHFQYILQASEAMVLVSYISPEWRHRHHLKLKLYLGLLALKERYQAVR